MALQAENAAGAFAALGARASAFALRSAGPITCVERDGQKLRTGAGNSSIMAF